jgi:molecular chaperone DnaJ
MDFNKNYYEILGVDKNASQDDIKKAYRKLAKEHHPDATQNEDDSIFKDLNEAYSIIGDEQERQKYDMQSPHGKNYQPGFGNQFFHMNINGQDFNPFGPFGFGFGQSPFDDPFFRDIFTRKEEFVENLDITIPVNITLKDVYNNTNIPIKFTHDVKCDVCNHSGFDPNSEAFECDACEGKGGDGFTKCKYCSGTGKIHTGTCSKCNGNKVVSRDEEFGFSNSYTIDKSFIKYMRSFGHQSRHYANKIGTIIVQANYIHDNRYVREGPNLIYQLNLHYQYAIDGYEFEYEHLDGKKYSFKIPPRTKDGELLRVAKKGLLMNLQQRGDLLIKVNIIVDYELLK